MLNDITVYKYVSLTGFYLLNTLNATATCTGYVPNSLGLRLSNASLCPATLDSSFAAQRSCKVTCNTGSVSVTSTFTCSTSVAGLVPPVTAIDCQGKSNFSRAASLSMAVLGHNINRIPACVQ